MKKALTMLLLTFASSCIYTSATPETSLLARKTSGEQGVVTLRDGVGSTGELIEVADSSLTVLETTRLVLIPFADIARAQFGLHFRTDRLSSRPSATTLEYGRTASRFPLGLTAPARDAILQGLGKPKVDTLRSARR